MNNKFKYLVLISLIGLLVIPGPVLAGPITAIQNIFDQILGGIEEVTKPMMRFMIGTAIAYVAGIGALVLTTHYLEVFIEAQDQWLSNISQATEAGFNFTLGLANLFLVLILLVIAFAFIFKLETFQAKKALPRLIIIALLLNFSWLFVNILVDIGSIIYNTLLPPGANLFTTAMSPFFQSAADVIINILIWMGAIIISWSIPYANAAAQVVFAALFAVVFLPNILVWVFQTFFFFTLSSMFAVFIFLFGARVFVIQICTIMAPLAFLCLILPQTQKYFNMWLKILVQWILLGIFFLFFLVLGFRIVGLLAPSSGPVPVPFLSWLSFGQYIGYYFAIFIYMGVVLYLGKKMLPTGAQGLIDYGKQVGGFVLAHGLKPMGGILRRGTSRMAVQQAEREKVIIVERPLRGWEKAEKAVGWTVRKAHLVAGTTPELEREKELERRVKQYEERFAKNTDAAAEVLLSRPSRLVADEEWAAWDLYAAQAEGRKGIERLSEEQRVKAMKALTSVAPKKVKEVVQHRPEFIVDPKIGTRVQAAIVPLGLKDPDVQELIKLGVEQAKAIKMAAFKKTLAKMKTEDVTEKTMASEEFKEAVIRFKGWGFSESLGREKSEYMEALQHKAEEMEKGIGLEALKKINSALINAPDSPAGRNLMRKWNWAKRGKKS